MSLLDNARKEAHVEAPVETAVTEAKKHSNSDYQKKQRELLAKHGKTVNDYIKTLKNVPQEVVGGISPSAGRQTGNHSYIR